MMARQRDFQVFADIILAAAERTIFRVS